MRHQLNNDELLQKRLKRGWRPIPSLLKDGNRILGYAENWREDEDNSTSS